MMLKTIKFILNHPINRGRPVSALIRYFSWQVQSRLQREVVVDWLEGTKLVARRGMTGATGNIYCGLHEYADMSFVLHLLRRGDLFIDVGANIGSYTVLASGVCGAHSIAIEPDPDAASHLMRNIVQNRIESLAEIRQTAIGDSSGSISFTVGKDTTNQVASSDDASVQTVPLSRLDDVLQGKGPTCLKFDVEGFETPALRGTRDVLAAPSLLAILIETVDREAHEILAYHQFEEVGYNPISRRLTVTPDLIVSNHLFVRDKPAIEKRLATSRIRTWRGMSV